MRVYQAAKKYNMTNEELIDLLGREGFSVKSHMGGVTDEMLVAIAKASSKTAPKAKAAPKVKTPAKKKTAAKAKLSEKAKATEKAKPVEKPKAVQKAKVSEKPKASGKAKAAEKVKAPEKAGKLTAADKSAPKSAKPVKPKPAARTAAPQPAPGEPSRRREGSRGGDLRKSPPGAARSVPAARPRRATTATEAQKKAVRESVRRTLAKIETTRRTKRRKSKPAPDEAREEAPVKVSEGTTVHELAATLKVDPSEVLAKCQELGIPATINQSLDQDTIEIISEELGRNVRFVSDEVENLLRAEVQIDEKRLVTRSPIVTVMGHVDHGKTSILDYIRKTRVASGEAGGITQHIGAYEVETDGGKMSFIDTPGHAAFTAMRARGAQITDIVILVVAADDGVMPQTIEAINHAKAADVPLIVAINKSDLPSANPNHIKQQLTEHSVVVEDFGGEVVCVEVSAKTGKGIDKLLEMILLQAELMELKADPMASAQATAIEVKKEEGRGILCTVLVTQGTLKVGDVFVIGSNYGKVRALLDYRGRPIKSVGPSTPAQLLGCNGMPEAGDKLTVVRGEKEARDLSLRRQELLKARERKSSKKLTLEELYTQIQDGVIKELRLVVKGDTNGSVEALCQSLEKLSFDEVAIKVIHAGVGVVGESDVLLASSSEALIIGFNVKVSPKAAEAAEREKVAIKTYEIIYEVLDDVDKAMKGLLEPDRVERVLGRAEVRKVFKVSRIGQIAGSYVMEGEIVRNSMARVIREDEVVFQGRISSLKRFQDDVRNVQKDFECGIGIADFSGLQEGDVVEAFVVEEKARVF